jgi:hypothetical protein
VRSPRDHDADDGAVGNVRATYGASFDRLVEIKKAYDPVNLFRVNRCIACHAAGE